MPRMMRPVIVMTFIDLFPLLLEFQRKARKTGARKYEFGFAVRPYISVKIAHRKLDTKSYLPAPSILITMTTTVQTVIQTAGLILSFQNPMRTDAALSSAGRIITQLYLHNKLREKEQTG